MQREFNSWHAVSLITFKCPVVQVEVIEVFGDEAFLWVDTLPSPAFVYVFEDLDL